MAKKNFIEFIRTDMSAEDVIVQPETPFTTEFDELVKDHHIVVLAIPKKGVTYTNK